MTGNDRIADIAADAAGFAVTGRSNHFFDEAVWVRRYDAGGSEVWDRTYDGPDGLDDWGSGVVLDSSGNVLVVGAEETDVDGHDTWVAKYTP